MMTKVLSALIMVSMVGTSVQVPTLAEVTNAGRAIVAGTVEDKAKDASGSTESKDAGAADDEDNKNQNDAENAENNEQAAASDSNAQNNTENSSKGGANTSSVSGAKNNSSSSSSYNNISSSNTSNNSTSTSQVLEPFSKDNDSDKLSFDKDFLTILIFRTNTNIFQQSLQMVTVATLSGKLNRSSSQFQHRKSRWCKEYR